MPSPGYGGGGYLTPVGGGTGGSGWNGSAWQGSPGWGVSGDDVLRAGAAARSGGPSSEEGMIVVFIGSKNANETPYTNFSLTVGAVSTYRVGAGGGWSILSTGYKNFELMKLDGKHALFAQGRTGTGTHTRLLIELRNLSVYYNDSAQNVSTPKDYYVIVDAVPVTGISAVMLTFDLNRSFAMSPDGSALVFTPVVEIDSLNGVRYSIGDDGAVDMSAGTLGLRELALFNETGGSAYSILGGTIAACMEACTGNCSSITAASCHARCSPRCFGVVDTVPNSCDDGTAYGACSSNEPLYCVTGTYTLRCGSCGCPQNYECLPDGSCTYMSISGSNACGGTGCIGGNQPMACSNGVKVSDCVACGCPEGSACRESTGMCEATVTPTPTP